MRAERTGLTKPVILLIAGLAALAAAGGWLWYWDGYGGRAARLARSPNRADRIQAIHELRGKAGGLARTALMGLVDDADEEIARWAVRALGTRRAQANRRLLEEILSSARPAPVRAEAADALGGYSQAGGKLLAGLLREDPDASIRAGAARGLGRLGDKAALPALLDGLDDPDPKVRNRCHTAIYRILKVRFPFDPQAPPARRRRQADSIRAMLKHYGAT